MVARAMSEGYFMRRGLLVVVFLGAAVANLPCQGLISIYADKDNTLYDSATGDISNGAGPAFYVGFTDDFEKRRALIHFDVAGQLPPGATVLTATLFLDAMFTSGGPLAVNLRRAPADWGQGTSNAGLPGGMGAPAKNGDATWLHRFYPSVLWSSPGGDFAPTVSATTFVSGSGIYSWSSTHLTADVASWLNNPAGNFGWVIKCPEEETHNAKRIGSRENPSLTARPRLEVTYLAPPTASVLDFGVGCNGLHLCPVGQPSIGNASFGLNVTGGLPGASAYVFASNGLASSPADLGGGCLLYLDLTSLFEYYNSGVYLGPAILDAMGDAPFPVAIPPSASLHGLVINLQCVTIGTSVGTSNGLTLILGS
jgi:hypothetical protein